MADWAQNTKLLTYYIIQVKQFSFGLFWYMIQIHPDITITADWAQNTKLLTSLLHDSEK